MVELELACLVRLVLLYPDETVHCPLLTLSLCV